MTHPRCICLWTFACFGTGVEHCDGCGGDQCVCRCGGARECPGCDACDDGDSPWDDQDSFDGRWS